jgi:lipid-binding SYLF domain-containing protein
MKLFKLLTLLSLSFLYADFNVAYTPPKCNIKKEQAKNKKKNYKSKPIVAYDEYIPKKNTTAKTAKNIYTTKVTPLDILKTTQDFYKEFKGGQELLKKASGYLVFPNVYDAGLIVGGKYGYGALVVNNSILSYYKLYSTSVGIKAGLQRFSLIVVFLTKESLKRFINKEEWKVSLDGGITFTNWKKGADINSLSLTKDTIVIPFNDVGLMANLSFEGTVFQKLP